MCRKTFRQRHICEGLKFTLNRGARFARHEQTRRQRIGLRALAPAGLHLLAQSAQIFDEHDPQGYRDSPKLADCQLLHALVSDDKAAKRIDIEMTIVVRHKGPRNSKHARIAREGAFGELGQLPIVSGRQVVPNFAYLFFDKVIIIE